MITLVIVTLSTPFPVNIARLSRMLEWHSSSGSSNSFQQKRESTIAATTAKEALTWLWIVHEQGDTNEVEMLYAMLSFGLTK